MTPAVQRLAGSFQPLLAPLHRIGGPLALAGLLVLAFWRILLTDQYTWLNGQDLAFQVLPWLQFQAGEWHAGRVPLWSPYEWGGQNLIGQAQPGVFSPLNLLLFAAPLKNGWLRQGVLHWWFWLIHYIAGLNLYFLARSLGTSKVAAVAGGLLFSLFGFVGSNDWPQMLTGIIWAPLVLLFLFRAAEERQPWRNAALAGLFLGLSWLSGHHQQPIFVHLAVAALVVVLRCWHGILSVILGGLIGAIQLLPALEYGKIARRWVGMENPVGWKDKVAYYVHEQYANAPSSLLSILLPGLETHMGLYLGATGLVLALWAVSRNWERREVRFLLFLGLGALLYQMGRWGFLQPLFYSLLPMVEKARSSSMAGSIFTLAFATLAALGLEEVLDGHDTALLSRLHWIFGGAVFGLYSLGLLFPVSQQRMEERWVSVAFISLLVGFLYRAVRERHIVLPQVPYWLVLAILIESANFTYFNMANRLDKNATQLLPPMSQLGDVREFLATRPGPIRITVDDKAVPYNFGDWHGVEVMGGYLASLTVRNLEVDWFSPRGLQLAAVGYHVGPSPRTADSKLLFTGAKGINVYEYPQGPNPRAFLVTRTVSYRSREELDALLQNPAIDLRTVAAVEAPVTGLGTCEPGAAQILRHDPGRVLVQTNAACPSLLVLADSYDPGWSVAVDGQSTSALVVNHAQRGVVVPAGGHTVAWRYTPVGFRAGAALTVLGLLAVAGLVLRR